MAHQKFSSRELFVALALCAEFALLAPRAEAQWYSDSTTNTPVCTLSGSQHDSPQICSDDSDGAIIVWQDTRNGSVSNIYAQRLNASGYALWAANGVRLSTPKIGNAPQRNPIVASDGNGGAYVVWQDSRNASANAIDLYGQHILANGLLAGPDTGIMVCSAVRDQVNPKLCSDGRGGAFVVWEDYSAAALGDQPDIGLNRIVDTAATLGPHGILAASGKSKQRNPAICDDGSGGCYVGWENGNTVPYSIWANHFGASGNALWGSLGFQVYQRICGGCTGAQATHVSVRRDGQQLMLTWEVTNTDSLYGQNIFATRLQCSTPTDSVPVWGSAAEVTGDNMLSDQIRPQIFSDDSATSLGPSFRGLLVAFENLRPNSTDDYDVSMIRVLGDGTTILPGNSTAYDFVRQPQGQVGFQALKADSTILMVWNDARYNGGTGPDTCIYAQRMDKYGNRYFPSYKTKSTWGVPICHTGMTAKQMTMAPRRDGAIVAWTDYRTGANNPNIYAQLILSDGSRYLDNAPPLTSITSRTGSFDNSLCNVRCTNVLAIDTGISRTGIDSILPNAMTNMRLTVSKFATGADSAVFTVCVIDSMRPGSASVKIQDALMNRDTMSFSYCALPDMIAPYVTWDSVSGWIDLHVRDDRPWDRGLLTITVTNSSNVTFVPSLSLVKPGSNVYITQVLPVDAGLPSSFCLKASDTAGNVSQVYCFTRSVADVPQISKDQPSISIFPSLVSGSATVWLEGVRSADVTVFDILGRAVDRFIVEGSYEWHPTSLGRGTYMLRAKVAGLQICKRFVRE